VAIRPAGPSVTAARKSAPIESVPTVSWGYGMTLSTATTPAELYVHERDPTSGNSGAEGVPDIVDRADDRSQLTTPRRQEP